MIEMHTDGNGGSVPPNALATLALLKNRYDAGKDYLGLFEPLVKGAIGTMDTEALRTQEVQSAVYERCGLAIPLNTLDGILRRLAHRKEISSEGGRFYQTVGRFDDFTRSLSDFRCK